MEGRMTLEQLAAANARKIPTEPIWRDETEEECRDRKARNELIYRAAIKRWFARTEADDPS
jgi:hypothetical protein